MMNFNSNNTDQVILVDHQNQPIGLMDKIKAHKEGALHRAFSIFLYRRHKDQVQWLLQQRAENKYHSGGLWTNTCCSHPRHLESIQSAATRRLKEELNIEPIGLQNIGETQYCLEVSPLIEHEHDTLLVAEYNRPVEDIHPNPNEVMGLKWVTLSSLEQTLQDQAHTYTAWLPHLMEMVRSYETNTLTLAKEACPC